MNNPTSSMGIKETFDYLVKQQQNGWPGSQSIHPYGRKKKKKKDESK